MFHHMNYNLLLIKQPRVKMAKKYKKLKRIEAFWPRLFYTLKMS